MAAEHIEIWVSRGSTAAPYYQFFADAKGNKQFIQLILDANHTYTFRRLAGETTHPFYISDTGINQNPSGETTINGSGSATAGIVGDESFTVSLEGEKA